jgi:hypothetical protein
MMLRMVAATAVTVSALVHLYLSLDGARKTTTSSGLRSCSMP